jgi:hypothetical protein
METKKPEKASKRKTDLNAPELDDFLVKKVADQVKQDLAAQNKPTPEQLEEYISSHSFDITRKPPEDVAVLFYKDLQVGSRGNIVTITGKAKSRKTVVASAIATSFFLPAGNTFLGFRAELQPDGKILHIDTEQGYLHYYESVVRIFRDAGVEIPDRFKSVHTRDADPEFRIELTEYLLEILKPDVLILDGVTDFIYDINSQEEAVRVGSLLLKWSYRFNCVIVVVIHTTKSTGYMTGAIGTYLEKKCETSIKVEKPEDREEVSHVSCQYSRNKAFESFTIEYDQRSERYKILDEQDITTKGPKGSREPEDYPDTVHKAIIQRIYVLRHSLNTHELTSQIVKGLKTITNDDIKASKVKSWIEYYNSQAWIMASPEGAWMRAELTATSTGSSAARKQDDLKFDVNASEMPATDPGPTDDLPF